MTTETSTPPSGSRKVALAVMLLGGALLAGALIAELGLRVYTRIGGRIAARLSDYDPFNVQVVPFGRDGYKQKPHARFRYGNGSVANANSMGFRGPEFSVEKAPGVSRIVLIGGSSTHGWGVDDSLTIDSYMRRILASRTAQRFEVINAAFDGYDSRQVLERLTHDVLRLDPDVVIINTGVNDVRNARLPNLVDDDPRTLIWRTEMDRLRREQEHGIAWGSYAKHYSLLMRLPVFVITQTQSNANRDTAITAYPEAAGYFERNIQRIVDVAGANKVRLVFSTEPSSLRTRYAPTAPPQRAYWLRNAEITAQYRDTLTERLARVVRQASARGSCVQHLRLQLPPDQFLDDAHLTADGNAALAAAFVDAATTALRQSC